MGRILIPIAVSARHVHLTQWAVNKLFGEGHQLRVHQWLSQPGQFAAEETVTLIGPHGSLGSVRIVGPTRDDNQVELSRSDEVLLGIEAPVRESGDLRGTPGLMLEGPGGRLALASGVVSALRHIHMTPNDASTLGLRDQDRVSTAVESVDRPLIFKDVVVRVSPNYRLEMHLDTDEANAAGVRHGTSAVLVSSAAR